MPERERFRSLDEVARAMHDAATFRPLPLLVLRLPELERIAWRDGRPSARKLERASAQAFYAAARSSLRAQDILGHDGGSDVFVAAMLDPPRKKSAALPSDCRGVLNRIVAKMTLTANLIVETGWSMVRTVDADARLIAEVCLALERGSRERERYDFFATVGHELRTPLASIHGYLETLLENDCDARLSRRFLESARREALRLGRLVNGMFEFSCLDVSADRQQACDVELAIRTARDAVAPTAASCGVRIDLLDIAPDVVPMGGDACVQAVINLLENAIKHGREHGTITISSTSRDGYVRIFVDDDGAGVPEIERHAIFGLRVRGACVRKPGAGIGLAIVRMFVERAGGEVRVVDSPFGGARFEMVLPVQADSLVLVS